MPGQSATALGVEVLGDRPGDGRDHGAAADHAADETGSEPMQWKASRWGVRAFSIVPFLVAGLSLLVESGGGLYWLVAGIVFATSGAVASAWVLMVEILR